MWTGLDGRRQNGRGWMEGDGLDGTGWREPEWPGLDGRRRNGRDWMEGDRMDGAG